MSKNYTLADIDFVQLARTIADYFKDAERFTTIRHIDECHADGSFVGDVYLTSLFEPTKDGFDMYTAVSPFSAATNKSTTQMLVYSNHQLVDSLDFTELIPLRTGVLDVVAMQTLGLAPTKEDKILIIGSGRVARSTAAALKAVYGSELDVDMTRLHYTRKTAAKSTEFENILPANYVDRTTLDLSSYSYIFCHTNSKEDVITTSNFAHYDRLKLLTYYIDNSIGFEVQPQWLEDFIAANGEEHVIVDIPETLTLKKEFGMIKADLGKIKSLGELLRTGETLQTPIVMRSGGSALQNTALYKVLPK